VKHVVFAASLAIATTLRAQTLQPEVRLDGMGPRPYSLEPGIGAIYAAGYYARITLGAGYALPLESTLNGIRWRADLLVRGTFDPFRQQRYALSLGAGLSYRRSRTYLAVVMDLEGPEIRGLLPALQVGVSGGPRVGIVLRRAIRGRR
jgi:hypothetical protein